jgi:hypothetical protein
MGLLRTILILLVIYFLFKLVARVILPLLLKNYVEKKHREFQDRFGQHQQKVKKEGEITIEKKSTKGKGKDDEGEYVDYEEIK